jgi:cobalamin biosynthetic protein CobC
LKHKHILQHGGNLRQAVAHYRIPLQHWIDLSTGINPCSWNPPTIPTSVWQRLPEEEDDLLATAQRYYGCENLLPIAGSQVAIQSLPFCRQPSRIAIVCPCYAEHAHWWERAGHSVVIITSDEIDLFIHGIDVLLLINPNNPDTTNYAIDDLLRWHQQLKKDNGWLIVDEAFIDSTPKKSLLTQCRTMPKGLIVLRSLGKFFGLAGIRLGFIAAEPRLLQKIAQQQGPWAISHPTRWIGTRALADQKWQQQTGVFLAKQSKKLHVCLSHYVKNVQKTNNFCYFQHPQAKKIQKELAMHGIWSRYFASPSAIRLGLPANQIALDKLNKALSGFLLW